MVKNLLLLSIFSITLHSYGQDESWVRDVTTQVGIEGKYGTKMYAADVNGDDYPDLITIESKNNTEYFNGRQTLHLYLNIQDPNNPIERAFKDVSASSGIWANTDEDTAQGRRTTAIALADVDNDGDLDMATAHYFHRKSDFNDIGDRAEILLNDGNGFFTLAPNNGLHELGPLNCQGLSFLDYDLDGNIDLFMGNWFEDYKALSNDVYMKDKLMKGNGDGTFTDVSDEVGINDPRETLYGSSCGDWNNDGYTDIFTAPYCRTRGALYMNNGDGTFTDVAREAGYNVHQMAGDNGQALCMWTAYPYDYDNDEDLDFFFSLVHGGLSNNEGRSTVVVNSGKDNDYKLSWDRSLLPYNVFPRPSHMAEYEASWFDIDNDGLTDIVHGQGSYTATKGRVYLFKQGEDHKFTDIAKLLGFIKNEYRTVNRIRTLDYDLDGDMDLLISGGPNNYMFLFKNEIGQKKNHINFKLGGIRGANRLSVGAKIKVYVGGDVLTKEVNAGYGNASGQDGFIINFGLGKNEFVDSVVVHWPNKEQTAINYGSLEINKLHKLGLFKGSTPDDKLIIYPNPKKDNKIYIHSPMHFTAKREMSIYRTDGSLVRSYSVTQSGDIAFEDNLAPGVYFVVITDENGNSSSGKLMVQ